MWSVRVQGLLMFMCWRVRPRSDQVTFNTDWYSEAFVFGGEKKTKKIELINEKRQKEREQEKEK